MIPKRDTKFYHNVELYLHRLFPQVINQSHPLTEESRQEYINLLKTQKGCISSSFMLRGDKLSLSLSVYKMSLQEQYLLFLLENDFKRSVKEVQKTSPQSVKG